MFKRDIINNGVYLLHTLHGRDVLTIRFSEKNTRFVHGIIPTQCHTIRKRRATYNPYRRRTRP